MRKKFIKEIDGKSIVIIKQDIQGICQLRVEVGTNGYQGGDTGHGSRTYIRLEDIGGTDMEIETGKNKYGSIYTEIKFGGDAELSNLLEALEFIQNTLKEQIKKQNK